VVLAPVAGVKSAKVFMPDRARKTIHSPATVARRIRRRGERAISRKTIRVRECRMYPVPPL
jgi:hypothetical protein